VRITITCPSCQQRSQIESAHRGRRLKCPYPACKQPFIVGDDGVARSPDQPVKAEPVPVEAVQDVVEVEAVEEQPEVADWQAPPVRKPVEPAHAETAQWEAPPVRRAGDATGFEPPPVRRTEEPSWEPPPIRRPGMEEPVVVAAEDVQVTEAAVEPAESSYYHAPVRKKRSGLLILILVGIVFVVSSGLIVFFLKQLQEREGTLSKKAYQAYTDGKYRLAKDLFTQMAEKFPNSPQKPDYEFMADLSDIRDGTTGVVGDVPDVHRKIGAFVSNWRSKPKYKEYQEDIWESMVSLAAAAADKARATADPAMLEIAKAASELARQESLSLRNQDKVSSRMAEVAKKLDQASQSVAMDAAKKQLLAVFADVIAKKVPGSAEVATRAYDEKVKQFPKLADDNDVKRQLDPIINEEASWVAYHGEPTPKLLPRGAAPGATGSVSVLVCPRLKGDAAAATAAKDSPVVLGLDRGVLYGLSQANGEVRWAMRVGVDTTLLPARLRAGPAQPELALVLSADTNTAAGVRTKDGVTEWHYKLGAPCSAGPILVGKPPTAYLPTEDGKIHVIEPLGGRLIGVYETGQNLTVPGAFDPISQRLFVPAAHRRILVLDLQSKSCAGVIYTHHAVGGLRGAPVIAPPEPGQAATLLIAEADSLDTMKLRPFSVPENVRDAKPVQDPGDPKPVEFTVPGWSWFMPYFDGDTLGVVTDRGYLALFGLKRRTNDRQVFRVSSQALAVGDTGASATTGQRPVGRAQIAAVDLGQWWLMVGGALQPHRFDLYRQQLVRSGRDALPLGIPLQETQSIANGQQLVLVTQALDRSEGIDRSMATCIATSTGKINWQRQLGFICGQEPLVVGDHVFAVDKLGGFLHIDTKKAVGVAQQPNQQWLTSVDWLANGAEESAVSQVLAAADGKSVVAITFLANSERLRVQKYDLAKGIQPEQVYRLDSPPHGTAVLTETAVLVPCRDGTLREFPLAGVRELPVPLTWRDPKAGHVPGHAALLSPAQVLISNGLNRLQQWNRSGNVWEKGQDSIELSTGRITTPVLVLPGAENDKYLCLGDDANNLHIFSASRLVPLREWRLDGKITKGPFARGNRIGCVVDGERLVWFDPNLDNPMWQYPAQGAGQGAGPIVGEPQLSGNQVVVAHQSGGYVWLDGETGAPKGQAQVGSQAIPTTGVVPFGQGRVLSTLSDGTLMVLTPSGG
jgi:outer membrane protein assembly factor BamB